MDIKFGKRRIRRVNYTRTVSLPKVWLETVGLDTGNWLEMEMLEDGSLILKPQRGGRDDKAIQ